ncbi:MAG TPA: cache domain-containing protein [Pyrinomonadaceae bacterium]|nr:cache domain-containing protein [Pyrinomonadaceae bacterium]
MSGFFLRYQLTRSVFRAQDLTAHIDVLMEERMKVGFLLVCILLSLAIGCSPVVKPTQSSPQSNQPKAQLSPDKSERGTPAEAQAMLQKAVEHYQSAARQQALADFTGKKPPFGDRDLYVFCLDLNGSTLTAHGAFPQYVGKSVDVWKDADGRPLGKAIQDAASKSEDGSIRYRMINPISGKIEPKISFWRKLAEDVCAVGAYNPE